MVFVRKVAHFAENRRKVDLVQAGNIHVLIAQVFQILSEFGPVCVGGAGSDGQNPVGHSFHISGQQAYNQILEGVHIRLGDLADHAKVDPFDFAVTGHNVALVGIRMEYTHVKHLVQIALQNVPAGLHRIDPLLDELILFGDGTAVHIGHSENALRRQLVDD